LPWYAVRILCSASFVCAWCGQEVQDEDAVVYTDYWGDEHMMCSAECAKEWHDETCDPEVE